jgi:dipeptidyl aminopeptidase/acylaminoacyl peptidase
VKRFLSLCSLVATVGAAVAAQAQEVDYARAEQFLYSGRNIPGAQVAPRWMEDDTRFWYRNSTGSGYEFVLVDPARNSQGPLFDHYRLAAAMSMANDTSYMPNKLPFSNFTFLRNESAIGFRLGKKQFDCDLRGYACALVDTLPDTRAFVTSPDSLWEVFAKDNNLFMRPRGGGDTTQLTSDGEEFFAYGLTKPGPSQVRRSSGPRRPSVQWAPDSKKFVVSRTDERNVEMMHWISYTPSRPAHYERPYALPGDSIIPVPSFHIIDISNAVAAADGSQDNDAAQGVTNIRVEFDPAPWSLMMNSSSVDSLWSSDSDELYVTYYTRGAKHLFLVEVDANTGEKKILAADSSQTNVIGQQYQSAKSYYITRDGQDVIWWSERDGWGHLWRYDQENNVKNQITSGAWPAGVIHWVDEDQEQIYFTGRGREPGHHIYYGHMYRVNFDGTGLQLLTSEDANHQISFAPSGRYFVDRMSRIEQPPVTVLRRASDGQIIRTVEEADISRAEEMGFRPAQDFVVKGRDGVTDVYGVIYFPPDIDSTKKYPIIEHIYPGPFVGSVGSWSFKSGGEQFALAQLGFVVVQVDHIGSRHRSKAFHDNYYGNMGDNGIPDHVAAVKQLAMRYPFMDLDRVGIYGHSGGGFASTDAILRFPEFYKVAVSGAGNHDQRSYGIHWGPVYQGLLERDSVTGKDNYESSANQSLATNLKGKLLLMHGDLDDNVHPANTIQVVNELIKANKDFDLVIAPNRAHGLGDGYFRRRRWDYFVRNLMGTEPPREYVFTAPSN